MNLELVPGGSESRDSEYKVHQLGKNNYIIWKKHMKNILTAKGLLDAVISDTSPTDPKENKARAILTSALNADNQMKVISCDTAHQIWKRLESIYENKTNWEKFNLIEKLHSFKIRSSSEIPDAISEMETIAEKLRLLGEPVSDEAMMCAMVRALPKPQFKMFVYNWKNTPATELL